MLSSRRPGAIRFARPAAGLCLVAIACAAIVGAAAGARSVGAALRSRKRFADRAEFEPRGLRDVLRWKLAAWRHGLPKPPATPTPQVEPEVARLQANASAGDAMQPTLTWIGHSTVLVQLGGLSVLTDPMFSERASPLGFVGPRRHVPPGLTLAQLPHIDVVLVSHDHYDHLDEPSVRALARQPGGAPLFVVPLGIGAWMARRGIANVVELDWWQSHAVASSRGPVDIVLTPAKHWSARGLGDRLATLWGSYAVFAPDLHLFFAGDTGYSKDFAEIRRRFADRPGGGDVDLALIPIGAYEPRWFMAQQHVDPAEAVRIHQDLGARQSLGIHWGTFELTDEPLDQPPRDLDAARAARGVDGSAFFVLAVGETRAVRARARRP